MIFRELHRHDRITHKKMISLTIELLSTKPLATTMIEITIIMITRRVSLPLRQKSMIPLVDTLNAHMCLKTNNQLDGSQILPNNESLKIFKA